MTEAERWREMAREWATLAKDSFDESVAELLERMAADAFKAADELEAEQNPGWLR